jgi:hypothetical protein
MISPGPYLFSCQAERLRGFVSAPLGGMGIVGKRSAGVTLGVRAAVRQSVFSAPATARFSFRGKGPQARGRGVGSLAGSALPAHSQNNFPFHSLSVGGKRWWFGRMAVGKAPGGALRHGFSFFKFPILLAGVVTRWRWLGHIAGADALGGCPRPALFLFAAP